MTDVFDRYFNVDNRWTQFQLYGVFPGELMLMLTGSIKSVTIHKDRLGLCCGSKFRAEGDTWVRLPVYEIFCLPGRMDQLAFQLSPSGRLLIGSHHPKESVLTILFPKDDSGDPEEKSLPIAKLDLQTITAMATEMHPGFAVTKNVGEQIIFPCGHSGHERWAHTIFGKAYLPTEEVIARREKCGQCWLDQQTKGITRCHACRGPILVGDTCWNYDGEIFCNAARCSAGPLGSFPNTWPGNSSSDHAHST